MGECNLTASIRVSGLKQVAMELKGKRQHKFVNCYKVPGQQKIYMRQRKHLSKNPADYFLCRGALQTL